MKKIVTLCIVFALFLSLHSHAQEINGTLNSDTINKTDANGMKTGYWEEKQGEVTYKGKYVNNKKVNDWIGYLPNNFIYRLEFYSDGIRNGISMQFDRKGKLTLAEHYSNGNLHGPSYYYSQNTQNPQTVTWFVNGKKSGLFRQYYDNGKIQEETYFLNEKKTGLSRWYSKSGKTLAEYNYIEGSFEGPQKTWYENDTLQTLSNYQNNQLSGEYKEYYRNGKLKITGKYINGVKEGPWTEFDELGNQVKVIRFKNGVETGK